MLTEILTDRFWLNPSIQERETTRENKTTQRAQLLSKGRFTNTLVFYDVLLQHDDVNPLCHHGDIMATS